MLPKPISAFMMSKYGTLLNYAAIVLAILMIGYSLLSSYSFYTRKMQYSSNLAPLVAAKHDGSYPNLIKVDLFGQYLSDSINVSKVKQSLLKIKLVGIISTTPPEQSFIMVSGLSGRDEQIKLGEEIMPGVRVVKIMANEIWIKHEGQIERLELPRPKLQFLQPDKSITME